MKLALGLGLAVVGLFAQDSVQAASCGDCTGCLWTYASGKTCFENTVKVACDGWGPDYTWCGAGATASPTVTPSPTSTSTPSPTSTQPGDAPRFVYSPYIDLDMGSSATLISRMDEIGLDTITLAFATGECGSEIWGSRSPSATVEVIKKLVAAKKKYIISTGGAAGMFSCGTDDAFLAFIETYKSDYLIGIDFDIEGGQTRAGIDSLVLRSKNAQRKYPSLRFSFTLATLGQSAGGNGLNWYGDQTMASLQANGLPNYLINLMAMDYGNTGQYLCVVVNGECDMGLSANQAALNLHNSYGVPYNQIELTVMIGGNDVVSETFKIEDVDDVGPFTIQNGLAGVHFWSLDRDVDCAPGAASPTCNTYGKAGPLGFSKKFQSYFK